MSAAQVSTGGVSTASSTGGRAPVSAPPLFAVSMDVPPSLNGAYASVGNKQRVISPKYRAWLQSAKHPIHRLLYGIIGWRPISIPTFIVIEVDRPRVNRDIDNCVKPILDVLVKEGVLEDDKLVAGVVPVWSPKHKKRIEHCRARVRVFKASDAPTLRFVADEQEPCTGYWEIL